MITQLSFYIAKDVRYYTLFFEKVCSCSHLRGAKLHTIFRVYMELKLAFLTLCDLALNPPFLGGKMIELGKFCFIKTKFEPNLSCFSK